MTDQTEIITPVLPAPTFEAVLALIKLAGGVQSFERRVRELQEATRAAETAKAELAAARAEHDAAIARERAELDARQTELRQREVEAFQRSAALDSRHEYLAGFARDLAARSGRYEQLPGGGVRDWGEAGKPDDVSSPITIQQPEPPTLVTERIPDAPAGVTLTRSAPAGSESIRGRRQARRQAGLI